MSPIPQIPLSAREPGTVVHFPDGARRCRVQASHRRVQELQKQITVKVARGDARGIRSDSQGETLFNRNWWGGDQFGRVGITQVVFYVEDKKKTIMELFRQNCGFRPNWKSIIFMASNDGKNASSSTALTLEALTAFWRRMESQNFHDEASQFVYIVTRFGTVPRSNHSKVHPSY